MNWCIVVNNGLSEHTGHSTVAAVAPLCARVHNASASPATLLQSGETSRDVELEVPTATTIGALHHHNNRLLIWLGFCQELYEGYLLVFLFLIFYLLIIYLL